MDAIDRLPYDACGPIAFRVLTKLANVANERGERAFRHAGAMASELGVSKRSVQRALSELEHARLIIRGDQRFVQHERADRRPTVYDINMRYQAEWGSETLEIDGVTRLSTTGHGVTNGVTTAVADKERRELLNSSTQSNHTADVTPCPSRGSRGHLIVDDTGVCCACAQHVTRELVNA